MRIHNRRVWETERAALLKLITPHKKVKMVMLLVYRNGGTGARGGRGGVMWL